MMHDMDFGRWKCTAFVCAALAMWGCGERPTAVTTDFEVTNQAGDWRGEVIYQLMTDRFANGDPNNDHGVVPGDLGRYQGGDWEGIADQVDYLVDLGVTTMRYMTNNPAKYGGIEGFGLEITERVPLESVPNPENIHYLRTKRERMGHLLEGLDDVL